MSVLHIIAQVCLYATLLCLATPTNAAIFTGPQSTDAPYLIPYDSGTVVSVLTVGDTPTDGSGYQLIGKPDGMGVIIDPNDPSQVIMLVAHELSSSQGPVHGHGSSGAFVSRWTMRRDTFEITSGRDFLQSANDLTVTTGTTTLARLCSASLADVEALYNAATGMGTQARVFTTGEESTDQGRGFAFFVTGGLIGTGVELPRMGHMRFENVVPRPYASDVTVVAGTDDATPGLITIYIGDKTNTGNDFERSGLDGGKLYGVKIVDYPNELCADYGVPRAFELVSLGPDGDVTGMTQSQLHTDAFGKLATQFSRPEDGEWRPNQGNHSIFSFATTTCPRIWSLHFNDTDDMLLGGMAVADTNPSDNVGTHFDAVAYEETGRFIYVCEDFIGHNNLVLRGDYDAADGKGIPPAFITVGSHDETESSGEFTGNFDMSKLLGPGWQTMNEQGTKTVASPLVKGGQMMMLLDAGLPLTPADPVIFRVTRTVLYDDTSDNVLIRSTAFGYDPNNINGYGPADTDGYITSLEYNFGVGQSPIASASGVPGTTPAVLTATHTYTARGGDASDPTPQRHLGTVLASSQGGSSITNVTFEADDRSAQQAGALTFISLGDGSSEPVVGLRLWNDTTAEGSLFTAGCPAVSANLCRTTAMGLTGVPSSTGNSPDDLVFSYRGMEALRIPANDASGSLKACGRQNLCAAVADQDPSDKAATSNDLVFTFNGKPRFIISPGSHSSPSLYPALLACGGRDLCALIDD